MFDAQGTQHVMYRGTDSDIHEFYWNGAWNTDDLTKASNAAPATGDPRGYVFCLDSVCVFTLAFATGLLGELALADACMGGELALRHADLLSPDLHRAFPGQEPVQLLNCERPARSDGAKGQRWRRCGRAITGICASAAQACGFRTTAP